MPIVTTNYNFIPLKTLEAIRDNGFRSKDAKKDYDPKLIEEAIWDKQAKSQEQHQNTVEKQMEELEIEREYLLSLVGTIKEGLDSSDSHSIISPFTMTCLLQDINNAMVNHI